MSENLTATGLSCAKETTQHYNLSGRTSRQILPFRSAASESGKGQTPLLGHCYPIISSANMDTRKFTWEASPTKILVTEKLLRL